jgi:hypothetical protein
MKEFTRPIPLVALMLGIGLFLLGQPILGAIAFIVWVSILALGSLRKTAELRAEDVADMLDPESRTLFAPVRRLTAEIEEIVSRNRDSAAIRTVGGEAETEARRIRDQIAHALTIRGELKRALRGQSLAERETNELGDRLKAATSDEERAALENAVAARQLELQHYLTVQSTLVKIDGGVEQAKAALSEMRARLSVGASGERAAEAVDSDDLRDTIGRMKALSVSFDEAEELLRG